MKMISRKVIALALSLCMAMSLLSVSALAAEEFEMPTPGNVSLSVTANRGGSYYLVRYRASLIMQDAFAEAAASVQGNDRLKELLFDCTLSDDLIAQMPDGTYSEGQLQSEYNFVFDDNDIYDFTTAVKSGNKLVLTYQLTPSTVNSWKTASASSVKADLVKMTTMSASREVPRAAIATLNLPMTSTAVVEIRNLAEKFPGLAHLVGDGVTLAQQGSSSLRISVPGGHGGGGGGGGGSTTGTPHNVTVNPSDHGTVSLGDNAAVPGDVVIIRVQPDDGYKVGDIVVLDANGNPVEVERVRNGVYAFTMPDTDVTVSVSFVPDEDQPVDPDNPKDPEGPVITPPSSTGLEELLNTDDHYAYIIGYPDGSVRPNGQITRAEVATILYRLLRDKSMGNSIIFSDVKPTQWFASAVDTLSSKGIINGYPDGSFKPNDPISRAEFVTMVVRFSHQDTPAKPISFGDLSTGHWAYQNIQISAGYGWVNGYEDGTFRPDGKISRAETATIVNRILGRKADRDYVYSHMDSIAYFHDLTDMNVWYYWEMIEATNGHNYSKNGAAETWSSIA